MENSFYDLADVLVCDPVAANRAATRSALYALGCRHIEIVADLHDFREALDQRRPDLALCEASVGETDLCQLIQEVRQGIKSYNPFVAVILTAWAMNANLLAQISNSGADDLLLRPFSTALLGQRIEGLVHRRKSYIVSSNYVGPERRKMARPVLNGVSVDPPNSLRIKALARAKSKDITASLDAELRLACAKLNAEKLRCDSARISVLATSLQTETAGSDQSIEVQSELAMILTSVEQRAHDSKHHAVDNIVFAIREGLARVQSGADCDVSIKRLADDALKLSQYYQAEKATIEL